MKSLASIALLLLPFTFAVKSTSDVFTTFHTKQVSSAPLKLNDATFDQLTNLPRNHTVAVLLTALEAKYGCQMCRDFQPEWDLLAKSWVKGDRAGDSRIVYGTLDFENGKGTFQKLQLQTAPILYLYPPTIGPGAKVDGQPLRYDFSTGSQSAEQIHGWISRHLPEGPRPAIVRPINYVRIISVVTVILGLITLFSVASPFILPIIQNRNVWAAISLVAVLLFTSGHMFNHIRQVPYVVGDGKGGISYFAGGFQNQFGLESQIVAALYGVLSFATINLAIKVPRIADSRRQQLAVFAWALVLLGTYSFLMSVFKVKNGGYPFGLPPFF